jgi:hypothetical protein
MNREQKSRILLSEGDLKIAKDKLNTKVSAKVFSPRYS